jgi:hypothetical protein
LFLNQPQQTRQDAFDFKHCQICRAEFATRLSTKEMFSNSLFVVFIIYSSLLCTPSDNDQSWTLSYTFYSCSGRCIKYIDVVRDDLVLRILLDKFDNVWSRMHLTAWRTYFHIFLWYFSLTILIMLLFTILHSIDSLLPRYWILNFFKYIF